MSRHHQSADGKRSVHCDLASGTCRNRTFDLLCYFHTKQFPKSGFIGYYEDVVRPLREQAFLNPFPQLLQGIAVLLSQLNCGIDDIVKIHRGVTLRLRSDRGHKQTASTTPFDQMKVREVLIRLANGIMVDLQSSGQRANAGKILACFQLPGGN
jgi:hypothetical protein